MYMYNVYIIYIYIYIYIYMRVCLCLYVDVLYNCDCVTVLLGKVSNEVRHSKGVQ